uniref:Uncharacterized protein n=1 Tax=Anguilla anguilla TaxID=7936 RepID=A0A0E9XN85_ANGAN
MHTHTHTQAYTHMHVHIDICINIQMRTQKHKYTEAHPHMCSQPCSKMLVLTQRYNLQRKTDVIYCNWCQNLSNPQMQSWCFTHIYVFNYLFYLFNLKTF